jgi:hypothetical protein
MAAKQVVQRKRLAPSVAKVLKAALGEIEVLELVKVTENRLSRIKALRATCALGEFGEPGLDFRRKAKSEHVDLLPLYMYSPRPRQGRAPLADFEQREGMQINACGSGQGA